MDLIEILKVLGIDPETGVMGCVIIVLALSVIQVSKIELNPWTMIGHALLVPFKCIGKAFTSDLTQRFESMSTDMKAMSDDIKRLHAEIDNMKRESDTMRQRDEEDKFVQKRYEIIRFGDDIRCNREYSLEHFNSVLDAITEYRHYCDTHPMFENSKAVSTIKFIEENYQERLKTNNFL